MDISNNKLATRNVLLVTVPALLCALFLVLQILRPQHAFALDPGGDVLGCFDNNGVYEGNPCIKAQCSWDNIARNWPEETGYHVDCENMLIKIAGYSHSEPDTGQCDALTPGCGYCPGIGNSSGCYLTDAEFVEYASVYSSLESEKLVRWPSDNIAAKVVNSEGGGYTEQGYAILKIVSGIAAMAPTGLVGYMVRRKLRS